MYVEYSIISSVATERKIPMQWIDLGDTYSLCLFDGPFKLECNLTKDLTDEVTDFEAKFKDSGNLSPTITTQFERKDISLMLARSKCTIAANEGEIAFKVPSDGRIVSGGWGIIDNFDADDYCHIYVEDRDRLLAYAYGGLSDADMQAVIPGYPIVASYVDADVAEENKGWYFWPLVRHDGTSGECEFEPIGGYGDIPGDMYLVIKIYRPNVADGVCRACVFWGKKV